jgi:hypothetical protein
VREHCFGPACRPFEKELASLTATHDDVSPLNHLHLHHHFHHHYHHHDFIIITIVIIVIIIIIILIASPFAQLVQTAISGGWVNSPVVPLLPLCQPLKARVKEWVLGSKRIIGNLMKSDGPAAVTPGTLVAHLHKQVGGLVRKTSLPLSFHAFSSGPVSGPMEPALSERQADQDQWRGRSGSVADA